AGHFASNEVVERFLLEARATAVLEHPHIVPIHEIGELSGQPFFTMPLLTGGSLQQLLTNGPLPAETAARVVQQVAEGVQYAHERGIVHRDIKPQNVLLQRDPTTPEAHSKGSTMPGKGSTMSGKGSIGADAPSITELPLVPRLTDFGLARLVQEGSGL